MAHESPLIAIIVVGLGLAFVFGIIANRLKTSPLVGYLMAGVVVGPFTPGFVADQGLAPQLAEIGVILLMFGVGLHFSLKDLLSVRAVAIPGALVQVAVATLLGAGLGRLFGWTWGGSLVFGISLSITSTVVVLRALQDRRLMETSRGRIAIGWLVIQDLVTVLTLVLLPPLAGLLKGDASGVSLAGIGLPLAVTLGKVAAFVVLMLVIGRRVIPLALHYVAQIGSRELFRLAVLVLALGAAFGAAELFDVSFALGAFFAGMILSESPLSQRAAEESLPFRDAFAVLFFVSAGMLFNPHVLVREPLALVGTLAILLVGTPLVTFGLLRLFRQTYAAAALLAVGFAQIGEFSFILAALGRSLDLLPQRGHDLILGASILSIFLNPVLFVLLDRLKPLIDRLDSRDQRAERIESGPPVTALTEHTVLIGHGRVGSLVLDGLLRAQEKVLLIEEGEEPVRDLRDKPVEILLGNAADAKILRAANLADARALIVAIPNAFEAGQIVRQARHANPDLEILARAHSDAEVKHLTQYGASSVVMGEREIARSMLHQVAAKDDNDVDDAMAEAAVAFPQ